MPDRPRARHERRWNRLIKARWNPRTPSAIASPGRSIPTTITRSATPRRMPAPASGPSRWGQPRCTSWIPTKGATAAITSPARFPNASTRR